MSVPSELQLICQQFSVATTEVPAGCSAHERGRAGHDRCNTAYIADHLADIGDIRTEYNAAEWHCRSGRVHRFVYSLSAHGATARTDAASEYYQVSVRATVSLCRPASCQFLEQSPVRCRQYRCLGNHDGAAVAVCLCTAASDPASQKCDRRS